MSLCSLHLTACIIFLLFSSGWRHDRCHLGVPAGPIRATGAGPGALQQVQDSQGRRQGHRVAGFEAGGASAPVSRGAVQRLQLCHVRLQYVVKTPTREACALLGASIGVVVVLHRPVICSSTSTRQKPGQRCDAVTAQRKTRLAPPSLPATPLTSATAGVLIYPSNAAKNIPH